MLLKTKLHTPRPRKDALPRPRLVDWLGANLDKPLLLVSAPAGYGKTTLLAQFTADAPLPVGWYQLDAGDNDPAAFIEYFVECIAGCCPDFGDTTRALLQSIQNIEAEWERLLVVLINEIVETVPEDILIILEDYHLIESSLIHAFIDRLLAQSPPQLHLLLSTRSDSLISLARLRARGQVAEMRGHDLRFTLEEARTFLNEVARLDLPAERIQVLVQETEGWAAALQLALTSLGRGPAPALQTSLEDLRGTNHHLFDYLSQEVLATQPPEVQAFLLGSSILEQMIAALCDAVLGIEDSGQILETLEAGNLFIVPLDDQREWYRYHHLFRDFLQEQLRRQQGDDMGGLHRKALAYFEAAGDVGRAIHHCQAAGETEKLAELVEQAAPGYLRRGRLRTVQGWLEAVPEEVTAGRPWLALYRGMILAIWGQAREAWLQLSGAQRAFAELDDELGESRALSQLCRVAFFEGRYQESLDLNHEALRRMPWTDHEGRVQALRDQCEVWLYLGDLNRAIHAIEEGLAHAQQLGDRAVLAEATIWEGSAYYHAGRLAEGMRTLKRGLSMLGDPAALGAHIAHGTIGFIHLERWELDEAFDHFGQSLALSQKFQDTGYMIFAHVTLGTIHVERDEFDEAQAHFEAALAIVEQTGTENMSAELVWHFVADWHAKAGRYSQAEAFSRKAIALRGEEAGGLAWGMGWLPLARVYLATGRPDEAEGILLDVEAASEKGGTFWSMIPSAVYLGRLYLERGREEEATAHIAKALQAAAPAGHRWMFLTQREEGVPLLIHALKHKIEPAFAQGLLRELGEAARSALNELIGHADPEVRRYAQELLPAASSQPLATTTAAAPPDVMHVTCFGDFQVTYRGQPVGEPGWLSTKAGDLFAYFITFRKGSLPKDRVLEALWPEMRPDRSSGAFHTALYKMRQMLRVNGEQGKFVQARGGEYSLEKEHFWIDADEFSRLMAECSRDSHPALERCEACATRLKRAVALYQGDYLQNLYYDWGLDEQRQLQERYLNALQVLATHQADRGNYEQALAYGRQVLVKDPLLEEAHRQMMRYYGRLGDRSGLIRQHQQLSTVLADELGVEPMPETQALYQNLIRKVAA